MLEYYLRPFFQKRLVDPVLHLIPNSITPLMLTLIAAGFGLLTPILSYFHAAILATVALFIAGYLDVVDGSLARSRHCQSNYGSAADIIADRFVEACAVIALFVVAPMQRGSLCLYLLTSFYLCISAFLVIAIFTANQSAKSFHYHIGFIERAEVLIFIGLMLCLPTWFRPLAITLTILVTLTAVIHLWQFKRNQNCPSPQKPPQ